MATIRNDITKVKAGNTELIKSAIKRLGSVTKAEVSAATGISVATCGKILNELFERGEILEDSILNNGYGRPAKSYSYNADYASVASIYLLSDQNRTSVSTVICNLLGQARFELTAELTEVTYEVLQGCVRTALERDPLIKIISIGIPGAVANGEVIMCNFIGLMRGTPLLQRLEDDFPGTVFVIENDMNASAYGFYKTECQEDTSVAFLFAPVGALTGLAGGQKISSEDQRLFNTGVNIGAGFVTSGRILHGSSGFAGEVAFLPGLWLDPDNPSLTTDAMVWIITAIVTILNPEIIALTGSYFTEENCEEIRSRCEQTIASRHMPQIILRGDFHHDYVQGLIQIALERLQFGVQLVEKCF